GDRRGWKTAAQFHLVSAIGLPSCCDKKRFTDPPYRYGKRSGCVRSKSVLHGQHALQAWGRIASPRRLHSRDNRLSRWKILESEPQQSGLRRKIRRYGGLARGSPNPERRAGLLDSLVFEGGCRRKHSAQGGERGEAEFPSIPLGGFDGRLIASARREIARCAMQEQAGCSSLPLYQLTHRPHVVRRDQSVPSAQGYGVTSVVHNNPTHRAACIRNPAHQDSVICCAIEVQAAHSPS